MGTNNCPSLILKVHMDDDFYFYGLLKHCCLINYLEKSDFLELKDVNFKDLREMHIGKTCTLEPQIEPKKS